MPLMRIFWLANERKLMTEVTADTIRHDPEIIDLVEIANRNLEAAGYTDHGFGHTTVVANRAKQLLIKLGKEPRTAELAAIAALMHDVGNAVNRRGHAMLGAILAKPILMRLGMPIHEVHEVIAAIGNHHEGEGDMVSDIAAGLVLADKSDVRESRVRASGDIIGDIHDRVNFAAKKSELYVAEEGGIIGIEIIVDPQVATVMEYFEIFLARMNACQLAAVHFGAKFELIINGVKLA